MEGYAVNKFVKMVTKMVTDSVFRGTQRQFSEEYLFGRRFEI